MTTTTTTNFNGKTLTLGDILTVPALLAAEGMTAQHGVSTARGKLGLLQTFKDGARRIVWITGSVRTENERP